MSFNGNRFFSSRHATYIVWIALIGCSNVWSATLATPRPTGSVASAVSQASGKTGATSWTSLSARQRSALAPLERDWAGMDGDSQEKWLALARRFPRMNPAERARIQTRMTEWAHTPAAERGKARLRYQRAKELSAQVRQAQWTAYQNLSKEQRRKLAEEAAARKRRHANTPSRAPHPAEARASSPLARYNTVASFRPRESTFKSIAPTIVQAKPGATTNLVSQRPAPIPHLKPGQPKIAAGPGLVDSATLLPRVGPQGTQAPIPGSSASPALR